MHDILATTKYERLTPEERERVKELRRMHIGEHAERSWAFESEIRARLAEQAPVSVADDAAAMLREVMFWEIKHEDRDFWNYRVGRCHKGCDADPKKNCCWHKMGLSRHNVKAARELLMALGLLEFTSGKGLPTGFHNRTHYRVNHLGLLEFLEKPLPTDLSTADEHSWYERTNCVGTNVHTLTESTPREDNHISIENTPVGVGFEFEVQESHDGQHDTTPPATDPRESEPFLGARIARSVQARLEDFHAYHLTDEEFATIEKDANALQRDGFDLAGLYEVADVLVDGFAHSGKLGRI